MKTKITQLSDAELDYWVAKAEGLLKVWKQGERENDFAPPAGTVVVYYDGMSRPLSSYRPTSDWELGGPIIERERIDLMTMGPTSPWFAELTDYSKSLPAGENVESYRGKGTWEGRTALVAAMRAYVASKFGDEVEV